MSNRFWREVMQERVNRKLAKHSETYGKHPPEIMAKVRAENRRQTLLKYLLIVLFGMALLVIASIAEAQILR